MAFVGTVRNVEDSGKRFPAPNLLLLIFLTGQDVLSVEEFLYQVVILGAVLHVEGYGVRYIAAEYLKEEL